MARDERFRDEEAEGCEHQQDAGPGERQHLEAEEADDEGDDPEGGGEDQARVEELDRDGEHPEGEQDGDDVRVDDRVEDAVPDATSRAVVTSASAVLRTMFFVPFVVCPSISFRSVDRSGAT